MSAPENPSNFLHNTNFFEKLSWNFIFFSRKGTGTINDVVSIESVDEYIMTELLPVDFSD